MLSLRQCQAWIRQPRRVPSRGLAFADLSQAMCLVPTQPGAAIRDGVPRRDQLWWPVRTPRRRLGLDEGQAEGGGLHAGTVALAASLGPRTWQRTAKGLVAFRVVTTLATGMLRGGT